MRIAAWPVFLLFVAAVANAAPETFMGMKVKEKAFKVAEGKKVTLHVTQAGPIPEENNDARFDAAGPVWDTTGATPIYSWLFGLALKAEAHPSRITIEDVTDSQPIMVVDDKAPQFKDRGQGARDWTGSSEDCIIDKRNPCAKWMFSWGTTFKIFRAQITSADGEVSELYQGAQFRSETLKPLLRSIGK